MKKCEKCGNKFGYIAFVNHRCYYPQEWKKFLKPLPADQIGNDYQFFNFERQRYESYETLTVAEMLLYRYDVIITGHTNRKRVGKMSKVPLKEKLKGGLKSLPGKITQKNLDKGLKTFDKGMAEFNKEMSNFSKGLGEKKSSPDKIWGKKKPAMKIWSEKKQKSNSLKIWSEPKKKRKSKRKSKSEEWDQNEKNLEKIWGKKK